MEEKDTVTITKKEYDRLKEAASRLSALEAAGVDNWSGFEAALESFEED